MERYLRVRDECETVRREADGFRTRFSVSLKKNALCDTLSATTRERIETALATDMFQAVLRELLKSEELEALAAAQAEARTLLREHPE